MKKTKMNYISEMLTLIFVLAAIVFQSVIIYKIYASNSVYATNTSSDMGKWLIEQGNNMLFGLLWLMLLASIIIFISLFIKVLYTFFEKHRKDGGENV